MTTAQDLKTGFEIFPIKTATACMLKWSWSSINMESGMTSSCHRSNYHAIDPADFSEFHNLPGKIEERKAMLKGEWPQGKCDYCQRAEQHNGISDRIMTMMRHHSVDKVPPELLKDSSALHVTPTILEIYFQNTCNLSCLYCLPTLSSKFNDEIRRFGEIKIPGFEKQLFKKSHQRYDDMCTDLWKYLKDQNRYLAIRHFNILGGEPFMQKELDQSIDFWKEHPNSSLTINLITNLIIDHDRFKEKISKLVDMIKSNSIYQLEITASIDSWGPEQEYVRQGIDLDLWEKNFQYLLDKKGILVSIHSCLSILTIKGLPKLFEKINQWNTAKIGGPIDYSFDVVLAHKHMLPMIGGSDLLRQDFLDILDQMPCQTENQITVKKQMEGVAEMVNADQGKRPESVALLKQYLDELDRRRNTNWKKTFGWLVDL